MTSRNNVGNNSLNDFEEGGILSPFIFSFHRRRRGKKSALPVRADGTFRYFVATDNNTEAMIQIAFSRTCLVTIKKRPVTETAVFSLR